MPLKAEVQKLPLMAMMAMMAMMAPRSTMAKARVKMPRLVTMTRI
ncbi:MAG TPA: hypothetical protein VGU01_14690 [Sphingomicrobium sp.]|nr:hypothetical protein [Sphingomicrobium sp.]